MKNLGLKNSKEKNGLNIFILIHIHNSKINSFITMIIIMVKFFLCVCWGCLLFKFMSISKYKQRHKNKNNHEREGNQTFSMLRVEMVLINYYRSLFVRIDFVRISNQIISSYYRYVCVCVYSLLILIKLCWRRRKKKEEDSDNLDKWWKHR